jgi:excisionase family DNA binding protein
MQALLSVEEAAAQLKIAPKTLRDWLRTGKLRGVKTGKYWRVREHDVERFVQAHVGAEPAVEPAPLRAPEAAGPGQPVPTVEWAATLVALVRALLPAGQRVYLRDKGITELPLFELNAVLAAQGLVIHAAKVRERRRSVTCTDHVGRVEGFGLFELRAREETRWSGR